MGKVLCSSTEKERVEGQFERYIKPVDPEAEIIYNKEFKVWECIGSKMIAYVPVTVTKE